MLLASAMLATAFSAGAAVDAKKGDAILLKSGTDNLSALTGTNFGKLGLTSTPADLNDWELKGLNGATWTVSAKKNTLGRDIYSFENKATGLTLAVDPTIAIDADKAGVGAKALTLGGTASEWVAEGDKLVSYFTGDSVVYIAKNGGDLYLKKTIVFFNRLVDKT